MCIDKNSAMGVAGGVVCRSSMTDALFCCTSTEAGLGSLLLSSSMVDMVSRQAVSADRGDYRRLGCGSVET